MSADLCCNSRPRSPAAVPAAPSLIGGCPRAGLEAEPPCAAPARGGSRAARPRGERFPAGAIWQVRAVTSGVAREPPEEERCRGCGCGGGGGGRARGAAVAAAWSAGPLCCGGTEGAGRAAAGGRATREEAAAVAQWPGSAEERRSRLSPAAAEQ